MRKFKDIYEINWVEIQDDSGVAFQVEFYLTEKQELPRLYIITRDELIEWMYKEDWNDAADMVPGFVNEDQPNDYLEPDMIGLLRDREEEIFRAYSLEVANTKIEA